MTPNTANPADNHSPQKNNNALIIFLKVMGILFLFSVLLAFGWIAGIIWFIFFRKKLDSEPDKQKKYTIGISAASALSLICFICMIINSLLTPDSLILSPSMESQELSVNSDYIIHVQYEPANASLSNVTYNIDHPNLASITFDADQPSVLTLHTKEEGSVCISAVTGTVESNVLSYEIIDYDRIAREQLAAAEKAAEEQRRKEAEAEEQRRQAEAEEQRRQAEAEAEEQRRQAEAEEQRRQAEAEAEEQRRQAEAEEQRRQAEAEAEEQRRQAEAEQLAAASSNGSSGSGSNGNSFNTYDNSEQQKTESTYVLNTSTKRIHHPSCSSVPKIAPRNYATSSETLEELTAQGYKTCGKCF